MSPNLFSSPGDQPEGEADGGEAAVARPARGKPAATTAAAAEEVEEQRGGPELPLAAAAGQCRRNGDGGDDDEPEVAGAAVAPAEPHHAAALATGNIYSKTYGNIWIMKRASGILGCVNNASDKDHATFVGSVYTY